jgi:hypothetical protein
MKSTFIISLLNILPEKSLINIKTNGMTKPCRSFILNNYSPDFTFKTKTILQTVSSKTYST